MFTLAGFCESTNRQQPRNFSTLFSVVSQIPKPHIGIVTYQTNRWNTKILTYLVRCKNCIALIILAYHEKHSGKINKNLKILPSLSLLYTAEKMRRRVEKKFITEIWPIWFTYIILLVWIVLQMKNCQKNIFFLIAVYFFILFLIVNFI